MDSVHRCFDGWKLYALHPSRSLHRTAQSLGVGTNESCSMVSVAGLFLFSNGPLNLCCRHPNVVVVVPEVLVLVVVDVCVADVCVADVCVVDVSVVDVCVVAVVVVVAVAVVAVVSVTVVAEVLVADVAVVVVVLEVVVVEPQSAALLIKWL